jgi:hypothetical protein
MVTDVPNVTDGRKCDWRVVIDGEFMDENRIGMIL